MPVRIVACPPRAASSPRAERTRETEAENQVLLLLLLAGATVVAVLFLLPGAPSGHRNHSGHPERLAPRRRDYRGRNPLGHPLKRWGYTYKRRPHDTFYRSTHHVDRARIPPEQDFRRFQRTES